MSVLSELLFNSAMIIVAVGLLALVEAARPSPGGDSLSADEWEITGDFLGM